MIILKIFIISWLLTNFSPIKMIIDIIPLTKLNSFLSLILSIIILPFKCTMCMSFWFGLFYTHNIFMAATASFVGYLWGLIQSRIEYTKFS